MVHETKLTPEISCPTNSCLAQLSEHWSHDLEVIIYSNVTHGLKNFSLVQTSLVLSAHLVGWSIFIFTKTRISLLYLSGLNDIHSYHSLVLRGILVTDRVRSTRRKVIFSLYLSVHTCRGYPGQVQMGRGVPQPGQDRGYPSQGDPPRVHSPSQVRMGGTLVGGTCLGYPLARSGRGVSQPGGTCPGYPPSRTGQHMEYLISSGWCASCVPTGGLSCFHSSFSRYAFLSDLSDLEVDFYHLILFVLIIWWSTHNLASTGNIYRP